MTRKNTQQNFIEGSVVLVVATFLVKILGAVYRIFLTQLIHSDGMGFYSTAYDIYLPIYSIAMAGLPIAISKIVSEQVAQQRFKHARKTLKVARKTFAITGSVGFGLMIALAFIYSKFILADSVSLWPILSIAPCILLCCIMSCYRGYYEGLRNMRPTAVSQVIEAAGKLIFGYIFAFVVIKIMGDNSRLTLSLAASGALFGIVIGSLLASLYLVLKYRREGDGFTEQELELSAQPESSKYVFKMLMTIAVPIVLASIVSNVTSLIDVTMVKYQLRKVIEGNFSQITEQFSAVLNSNEVAQEVVDSVKSGDVSAFAAAFSNTLYGMHRGYAYSIYNLVPVITSMFGISAIPTLATAWARKDKAEIKSGIETVVRTTAIIAMPIGAGIIAVSWAILNLLYGADAPETVMIIQHNLRVLGFCAVFCGLVMPVTNMLQAIGKQNIPLITMTVGAAIKIVTNLVLVSNPDINIYGVPYGTTLCYAFIFTANFVCLVKYSKVKISLLSTLIKPAICAVVCGLSAYLSFKAIQMFSDSRIVLVLIPIIVAALFYVISLSITRTISENDIKMLPKGEILVKLLAKLKVIR